MGWKGAWNETKDSPLKTYRAHGPFDVPLWDEMTAAILADPSLITGHQSFRMDVDIDHGAGYGRALIYSEKNAPRLDEQPVDVVTDIDQTRFTDLFVAVMQVKP